MQHHTCTNLELGVGQVEEVHLLQADVAEQLLAIPDQCCKQAIY